MADAVTIRSLLTGASRATVVLTNISDGTGEAAVKKVDRSTLATVLGVEPARLSIARVDWCSYGFAHIKLAWDHTDDDTALVLAPGIGKFCFERTAPLPDPLSAGGSGDLLLTAVPITGATQAAYTVVLSLKF